MEWQEDLIYFVCISDFKKVQMQHLQSNVQTWMDSLRFWRITSQHNHMLFFQQCFSPPVCFSLKINTYITNYMTGAAPLWLLVEKQESLGTAWLFFALWEWTMASSFTPALSARRFFNRADKYSSIKCPQVSHSLTRSSSSFTDTSIHGCSSHLFVITLWNIHIQEKRCNLKTKWGDLFVLFHRNGLIMSQRSI